MKKIITILFLTVTVNVLVGQNNANALSSSVWLSNTIEVCWENPGPGNAEGRRWTREAVSDTWEKHSKVRFTGWGTCTTQSLGIRIGIQDDGPHVKKLGRRVDGIPYGMILNFTFNNWSMDCRRSREYCIKAIAAHEFGHALGFAHEQNRPDAPTQCQDQAQGENGDWFINDYDVNSIMNYCNPKWNNWGQLSTGDIKGVQALYGANGINCVDGKRVTSLMSGDYDGDGVNDVSWLYDYDNNFSRMHTFKSNRNRLIFSGDRGWFECSQCDAKKTVGVHSGDFDGDRKDDIAWIYDYGDNKTYIHAFLSNGSNFIAQGSWWGEGKPTNGKAIKHSESGDFNGDGKDDLAWVYDYGNNKTYIHVFLSDGRKFDFQGSWWGEGNPTNGNAIKELVSGDFNGDRIDDLAWIYDYGNNNVHIHVLTSNGGQFNFQGQWWGEGKETNAESILHLASGDFNGDRIDDIALVYNYGYDNAQILTFLSERDRFNFQGSWYANAGNMVGASIEKIAVSDFDNDGLSDISLVYNYGGDNASILMFLSMKNSFRFDGGWWNCDN